LEYSYLLDRAYEYGKAVRVIIAFSLDSYWTTFFVKRHISKCLSIANSFSEYLWCFFFFFFEFITLRLVLFNVFFLFFIIIIWHSWIVNTFWCLLWDGKQKGDSPWTVIDSLLYILIALKFMVFATNIEHLNYLWVFGNSRISATKLVSLFCSWCFFAVILTCTLRFHMK
jgi:hypothetical protein